MTRLHAFLRQYGYGHVQLPAIEEASLFLNKAGDQIIANLLTFERLGKELALRPEFTALAAHRYARRFSGSSAVVRWQFNGSVFMDNYSNRDRRYQYMSAGAELFGMSHRPYADAEIMTVAVRGIPNKVELYVGHVGLIRAIIAHYQLDDRTERFLLNHTGALMRGKMEPADVITQFDRYVAHDVPTMQQDNPITGSALEQDIQRMLDALLDANQRGTTMGGRGRDDIVKRLVKKRQRVAQRSQVSDAIHHIRNWSALSGDIATALPKMRDLIPDSATEQFDNWQEALSLAVQMGVEESQIQLAPGLIRDWNYYTGIVFEICDAQNHVYGGGGRYDELVRLMGGNKDVPAVGFAYDVDEIVHRLTMDTMEQRPSVALAIGDDPTHVIKWQNALHHAGVDVSIVQNNPQPQVQTIQIQKNGTITYQGQQYVLEDVPKLKQKVEGTV